MGLFALLQMGDPVISNHREQPSLAQPPVENLLVSPEAPTEASQPPSTGPYTTTVEANPDIGPGVSLFALTVNVSVSPAWDSITGALAFGLVWSERWWPISHQTFCVLSSSLQTFFLIRVLHLSTLCVQQTLSLRGAWHLMFFTDCFSFCCCTL